MKPNQHCSATTRPLGLAPIAALAAVMLAMIGPAATAVAQERFDFDILRNGKPVGEHELRISRVGNETLVSAQSAIDVKFLGFTVYRMRYRAEELWDPVGLKTLSVAVDDDGRSRRIDGRRLGKRFHWAAPDGREYSAAMPVFPTNHWNPDMLESRTLLNTLTGQANRVDVTPVDSVADVEFPATSDQPVRAFRYEGELNLQTWYDQQGRWLGMRFKGRDGSDIEYRCRNCRGSVVL